MRISAVTRQRSLQRHVPCGPKRKLNMDSLEAITKALSVQVSVRVRRSFHMAAIRRGRCYRQSKIFLRARGPTVDPGPDQLPEPFLGAGYGIAAWPGLPAPCHQVVFR